MITLNQPNHLGKKAYMLMASRKMTAGLVILLAAAVLLVLSGSISSFIVGLMKTSGMASVKSVAAVSTTVMDIVLAAFILALVVCLVGLIAARLQYANFTFTLEEFDLKLKRGIIGTSIVSIPYRQMQDINVERSAMHRLTGTARVIIDSAGHEESSEHNETDIILDPIDQEMAEDIRATLQRKIGVQIVEGEKEADHAAGV